MLTVFYSVLLFCLLINCYLWEGLIGLSAHLRVACFLQGNAGFVVGSAREIFVDTVKFQE